MQLPYVDVVIYSFHYLLDPKIAERVSKEMDKNSIVVFDEAHNIDNVCIESLSIDLTRPMLDSAARSVTALNEKVEEIKRTDASKLQDEYQKLFGSHVALERKLATAREQVRYPICLLYV